MRCVLLISFLFLSFNAWAQPLGKMDMYLASTSISTTAKDYYRGAFKASDDQRTFAIMDSLETKNNASRPFYLFLVSKMIDHSDGALGEALCGTCAAFLEEHPSNFIAYLNSLPAAARYKKMDKWALTAAGEYLISCEGKEMYCINDSYKKATAKVSKQYASILKDVYASIRHYASQ